MVEKGSRVTQCWSSARESQRGLSRDSQLVTAAEKGCMSDMGSVDLSVIICTLNRSHLLRKCLESLAGQEATQFTFEIIVVDNGSTDDTKAVVRAFDGAFSGLRYVFEGVKGVGHARNVGFRASIGRYIAYLDDDTIPGPCWCATICRTFALIENSPGKDNRDVACLGGPVEPIFETGEPSWLTPKLRVVYAIVDRGEEPRLYPSSEVPLSANLAFIRRVLPEPPWNDRLPMCEDIELGLRLRGIGIRSLYVPEMRVQHFVSGKRLRPEWLLRRYFAEGLAQRHLPLGRRSRTRLAVAAALKLPALSVLSAFTPGNRRLERRCTVRFYCGYLAGLAGLKALNKTGYIADRQRSVF